jgi:parvulin-like peptidyl-prolyl isomerase
MALFRMTRLPLVILLALTLAVAAAACGGGSDDVPDNAVAIVGDDEITKAEFDALMARAESAYKQQKRPFPKTGTPEYKTLQNQAIQYLVQQSRYEQKADELGLEITDQEIDKRVEQIKKQYFAGKEKDWQAHLKSQKLTEEQVRSDVRNQLISEEIYDEVTEGIKISDQEIAAYYNKNKKQYEQAESREVRHILVAKKPLADRLRRQLVNGASFAALAKRYSTDPSSKSSGGKLTISRGQTVPPFDKAAFSLKKNQLSQPVKTTYGYHLIEPLSDVKPKKTTPLKDVKEQIRQQLLQQERQQEIAKWSKDVTEEFKDDTHYQVGYAPPSTSTTATTNSG